MVNDKILSVPDGEIRYRLIRSAVRKRTMQISVQPPNEVIVSVPARYSESEIKDFLMRKSAWILRKLNVFKTHALRSAPETNDAKGCLYLGQLYPLQCLPTEAKWGKVDFDQSKFAVYVPQRVVSEQQSCYVRDFLLKWFKARALTIFKERTKLYAQQVGVQPSQIHVRSARRLWGSCHPVKRILHFNWKLLMAPLETLDYVVVHELCHMKVPNHSREFWNLVKRHVVDFKKHHVWLQLNGYRLVLP